MTIRAATPDDGEAIASIYNYYIANTIITFEEEVVTGEEMSARITATKEDYPYLIYQQADTILGYTYACRWRPRSAYRFAAEISVYLDQGYHGRGLGSALYLALFDELRKQSVHTVLGGISLPNAASVALHEKLGFKKVAQLAQVGLKFGKWIDVGYWQRTL